jgi:hypothetical protein
VLLFQTDHLIRLANGDPCRALLIQIHRALVLLDGRGRGLGRVRGLDLPHRIRIVHEVV